ncbi:unnamed protein product [marine sediment metagenome]|uniref:4Fe4S-binding SPASM domain-containing protein n=1 Tax=marine sediment metagenome TaxID=412755 RepID=X0TCR5_9ZZZZ
MCDIFGDLYPCGCSAYNRRYFLGNIDFLSYSTFFPVVKKLHFKGKKYFEECQNCDAAQICNFGCPAFDDIDALTADSECNANRMFFSFLESRKKSKIKNIIENVGRRTSQIGERIDGSICKRNSDLRMP